MFSGQVVDIEETPKAMREALVKVEAEALKDIGCDGNEADEMAHEKVDSLFNDTIACLIRKMEIK